MSYTAIKIWNGTSSMWPRSPILKWWPGSGAFAVLISCPKPEPCSDLQGFAFSNHRENPFSQIFWLCSYSKACTLQVSCYYPIFFKFGYSISYKFIDRGIFELLGPTGLSFSTVGLGSDLYKNQTSYMYHYTYSILVSLTVLFLLREFGSLLDFSLDFRVLFLFFFSIFFLRTLQKSSEK